ncbi:unnamed protein product [Aureobasidium vineae]|uniref:Uncharacterized protein n=1 Tax=Aureobasidium vineae TaxID=2773715 RepID=A0A9N8P4X8_9PEZI|nr:unnamed protein product [Aureobasidium vineae]
MRDGYRNEMFSSMIADVIDGHSGVLFQTERNSPEQQEQRIWELDSEEESPTEDEKQKKKAKNKKKYLRKKERAQAEKAELEQQKAGTKEDVASGLAGLSVQDDATPSMDEDHRSSGADANTTGIPTPTQPKLSKRQKKTLLKKAKQAQNKTLAPESTRSSNTGDCTSDSSALNSKIPKDNENEKEIKIKISSNGHKESEHEDMQKYVATESEVEAVLETVAKRFGQ